MQIAVFVKTKINEVYLVEYDMKDSIEGRDLRITLSGSNPGLALIFYISAGRYTQGESAWELTPLERTGL